MPADAGYKEARAISEAAREKDWKLPSFGKGLYLGHFEPELISPQPVDNGREDACAQVMELTDGVGADVSFEAVGLQQTFELATQLIRPCGRVANIGVHDKPVTLHLETLSGPAISQ